MINVVITDDHQLVLEGLTLLLDGTKEITVHKCYRSAHLLLEGLKEHVPDVVLMDINMPEMNGIEACRVVKKEYPGVKVIALSMISESNLIKLMLKNGADGYLHKNAGRDEIVEAICDVHAGKKYLSQEISDILIGQDLKDDHKISNSPFPKLSRREEQILELIIDEKTTQEISEQLFISFGTVETHRRNIMIKLGVKNTAGMVRIALEYGLVKR